MIDRSGRSKVRSKDFQDAYASLSNEGAEKVSTLETADTSGSDEGFYVFVVRGIWIGGGIPLLLGLVMLIRYQASLPELQPGEVHCATGALGPFCIILFGTPMGAVTGGLTGALCRMID